MATFDEEKKQLIKEAAEKIHKIEDEVAGRARGRDDSGSSQIMAINRKLGLDLKALAEKYGRTTV